MYGAYWPRSAASVSIEFACFYLDIFCWMFNTYFLDKQYIKPFSLIHNVGKLRKENESPEFQRLKSMQGIRFYNMLLIIFCHTFSSYIGGYVLNTDYFEVVSIIKYYKMPYCILKKIFRYYLSKIMIVALILI